MIRVGRAKLGTLYSKSTGKHSDSVMLEQQTFYDVLFLHQ